RRLIRHCRDIGTSMLVVEAGASVENGRSQEGWHELCWILEESLRLTLLDPAAWLIGSDQEHLPEDLDRLLQSLGPRARLIHAKDLWFGAQGPATPRLRHGLLDMA